MRPKVPTFRRRVCAVRQRDDGTWAITLGPGPDLIWLRTDEPHQHGSLVEVTTHAPMRHRRFGRGSVAVVEAGSISAVAPAPVTHEVSSAWRKRVVQSVRIALRPHQIAGSAWLASRLARSLGALLLDDAGLGKTIQCYAALVASAKLPAIVVCPAMVKDQWVREARLVDPRLRVAALEGGDGKIPRAHVLVINYALLRPRYDQLLRLGARAIVFDECQFIKRPDPQDASHRAAVATALAREIGPAILATGTPLSNDATELWRLLHIAEPVEWPSYEEYKERYCAQPPEWDTTSSVVKTDHGTAARIEELQARVAAVSIRRRKGTILADLPPKRYRVVRVELPRKYRLAYEAAGHKLTRVSGAHNPEDALNRLTALRRLAAMGKMRRAFADYLDAWFAREKRPLVIFGHHVAVMRRAAEICRRLGLRAVSLSRSRGDDRAHAVRSFTHGTADVMLAPIRAAGVGLNLQRRCCDVLYLERSYVWSEMSQSEDRVHRIGQTRPVTVTYMDAAGTVDEEIAAVYRAKERLIGAVLADSSMSEREQAIETIEAMLSRVA